MREWKAVVDISELRYWDTPGGRVGFTYKEYNVGTPPHLGVTMPAKN